MNRREFLETISAAAIAAGTAGTSQASPPQRQTGAKSVYNLHTPKLETVRLGYIGMGARGPSHLDAAMACQGVQIVAICDNHAPSAEKGRKMVESAKRPAPALYTRGDYDYRRMLERDDIDAVFISTPWEWHVPMAVDTMKAGKHALVEVPAAYTVEDCWKLVDTAEKMQRHCMMLENVCYGREELMVLNMCRLGVFGELLHGEAAYIHDLRGQMHEIERGTGSWRTLHYTKRNGNLYPTHGLGPICQYMNINRGDRMDFMSSVSSKSRVRSIYAQDHFPVGHPRRKLKFVAGDINTSIVRTVQGRTMMIQWDEQLPRPYTRHNLIQGTKGVWAGFPNRVVVEGVSRSTDSWDMNADLRQWFDKYDHPIWKKLASEAAAHGGHGGMDFVMVWRIIYCLRNGLPLDQDVYDAAAWSVITPLSEWSVANRGQSVNVPDFTRGQWKTMRPLDLST